MTAFRNAVYDSIVPMNAAMTLWIFGGRVLFGVPFGWTVIVSMFLLPVLALMLVITTVLAARQRRQPPRLSAAQAWLHVLLWISLGLLGVSIVDSIEEGLDIDLAGGISEPENLSSIFTRIVGWSPGAVLMSVRLMYVFTVTSVVLWAALAIALAVGTVAARRSPPPGRLQ